MMGYNLETNDFPVDGVGDLKYFYPVLRSVPVP